MPSIVLKSGKRLSYQDSRMASFVKRCEKLAQCTEDFTLNELTTVLFVGETGTGKGAFARYFHEISARQNGPFVSVSCGSLPEGLLSSELFGYLAGAFTGARRGGKSGLVEKAQGGTLFLDEMNSMPLSQQAALLRLIDDGVYLRLGSTHEKQGNLQIIAAVNEPLSAMLEQGKIRKDLYFRLTGYTLTIPPLRQRKRDIACLAQDFLSILSEKQGRTYSITPRARACLWQHPWQGNVRELLNVVQQAAMKAFIRQGHQEEVFLKELDVREFLAQEAGQEGGRDAEIEGIKPGEEENFLLTVSPENVTQALWEQVDAFMQELRDPAFQDSLPPEKRTQWQDQILGLFFDIQSTSGNPFVQHVYRVAKAYGIPEMMACKEESIYRYFMGFIHNKKMKTSLIEAMACYLYRGLNRPSLVKDFYDAAERWNAVTEPHIKSPGRLPLQRRLQAMAFRSAAAAAEL